MPRPSYSDQENELIRQELLAGAIKLFRDESIDDLSLRRLAARMDISHTKLYRYFESKEELLAAMRLFILERLGQSLRENDPTHLPPLDRMKAASHALHAFASQNQAEYFFLFSDPVRETEVDKDILEARHGIFNFIVEIAEAAHKAGDTRMDGRTLANLSWAMLHGLFALGFRGQLMEGRSFEELLESAMHLLFAPARSKK
jgi:AcrR family transcriptional regulator